jgi:hypothetical protein
MKPVSTGSTCAIVVSLERGELELLQALGVGDEVQRHDPATAYECCADGEEPSLARGGPAGGAVDERGPDDEVELRVRTRPAGDGFRPAHLDRCVVACCSIQPPSGLLVHAKYSIRRLPMQMKTSTYSRRSNTVSTVRKSQASVVAACWRRNDRQSSRSRSGRGWTPAAFRTLRTSVAETSMPSLRSSPAIRR